MKKLIFAFAAFIFASVAWSAEQPVLKVNITDHENPDFKVNVNLPLSLIRSMQPSLQEHFNEIRFDGQDIDFRAIWREVRNVGPHQFVEVNSEDQTINVYTDENDMHINVTGLDDRGAPMDARVRIPLFLGDVLFNDNDALDMDALMDALEVLQGQELAVIEAENKKIVVSVE